MTRGLLTDMAVTVRETHEVYFARRATFFAGPPLI